MYNIFAILSVLLYSYTTFYYNCILYSIYFEVILYNKFAFSERLEFLAPSIFEDAFLRLCCATFVLCLLLLVDCSLIRIIKLYTRWNMFIFYFIIKIVSHLFFFINFRHSFYSFIVASHKILTICTRFSPVAFVFLQPASFLQDRLQHRLFSANRKYFVFLKTS